MSRLKFLLLLSVLPALNNAFAQSKYFRGTVGLTAGTTQYNGELANDFYGFHTTNAFTGLSYSHYVSSRFDIRLNVALGSWGYSSDKSYSFDADFIHLNTDLKFKFVRRDNPRLSPYVFAGLGINNFSNWILYADSETAIVYDTFGVPITDFKDNNPHFIPSGGIGVQVRLAERVFLTVDERFLLPYTNQADGITQERYDYMLMHTIGISFGVFAWGDADKDGVNDKRDRCPVTPAIAKVDEFGCPIDGDGDGIADFEDVCPIVAGVISGMGCPDADGDSFVDNEDDCPGIPGIASFEGCPDTDMDGLKDSEDHCPEIKGLAHFHGCPDSDNDGVEDPKDHCPETPTEAKVDAGGCPEDSDKDGIADYLDQCPLYPGTIENSGCPRVKEEVKELFRKALSGIKFETGKDVIRNESFAILDSVVKAMTENPSYLLKISGHTDNVGDPERNRILSDNRAKAVRQYLIVHGVPEKKISGATGYGDTKPIADNSTKEGRAMNRRVEFEVEF